MPRLKRPYGSLLASSCPHLSNENGGFAVTTSKCNKPLPSLSNSKGLRIVSPHSIRWLSSPCRNIFIFASAQVKPIASWPNKAYFLEPEFLRTIAPHFNSNEPKPQAGSHIWSPSTGSKIVANKSDTSGEI